MTKITHIAALTGLVAVLTGPAFAGDQDSLTLLRDSGRYVAEAGLARNSFVPMPHVKGAQMPSVAHDFQLDGR